VTKQVFSKQTKYLAYIHPLYQWKESWGRIQESKKL